MRKRIILIIILLLIASTAFIFIIQNKDKDYFNRTYTNTIQSDIGPLEAHNVTFYKNKKYVYYVEKEGNRTIIQTGKYYYDTEKKEIHISYKKDGEEWKNTLYWNKIDSNTELLFPVEYKDYRYNLILYLVQ